jgi:hypothetical protein
MYVSCPGVNINSYAISNNRLYLFGSIYQNATEYVYIQDTSVSLLNFGQDVANLPIGAIQEYDTFLLTFDLVERKLLFYNRIFSKYSDFSTALTFDPSGNVFLAGKSDTIQISSYLYEFDSNSETKSETISYDGTETDSLFPNSGYNSWIIRYDSNTNPTKQTPKRNALLESASQNEDITCIAYSKTEKAIYVGFINPTTNNSIRIRNFNNVSYTRRFGGSYNSMIIKLGDEGTTLTEFSVVFGGSGGEYPKSMCVDTDSNLYAAILCDTGVQISNRVSTNDAANTLYNSYTHPTVGTRLIAFIKFNLNLVPKWEAFITYNGGNDDVKPRCAVNSSGVYLLFASYSTTSIPNIRKFDNPITNTDPGVSFTMSTSGDYACLVKFTSSGDYQWHLLFNNSQTGGVVDNLYVDNDYVFVGLTYFGRFSCTDLAGATITYGVNNQQGTILLYVSNSGSVQVVSYTNTNPLS